MARLRQIPGGFDKRRLSDIDARFGAIQTEHRVAIAIAVESGSRAWGFPSPDSDFDGRFLFVRGTEAYLSPWPPRDVIETPLIDDLDIGGWDLGKALKLLLKGNAVVIEWLMSPVVYDGDPLFRAEMLAFATAHAPRDGIVRHYLHLGERQRKTCFADEKEVQLKKLFYALRPAAALRWLRLHPEAAIPPMHFPTLIAEADPPADVLALTDALTKRKAKARELGTAPLPGPIREFADGEFAIARQSVSLGPARPRPEAREAAEELFRRWVGRLRAA